MLRRIGKRKVWCQLYVFILLIPFDTLGKVFNMVATRSSTRKSTVSSSTASPIAVNGNGSRNVKKRDGAQINCDHESKRQKVAEPVDRTRWRLKADEGRQTWHYLDDDAAVTKWPQSYADKWYLDLPLVSLDIAANDAQHADKILQ